MNRREDRTMVIVVLGQVWIVCPLFFVFCFAFPVFPRPSGSRWAKSDIASPVLFVTVPYQRSRLIPFLAPSLVPALGHSSESRRRSSKYFVYSTAFLISILFEGKLQKYCPRGCACRSPHVATVLIMIYHIDLRAP